MAIQNSTFTQAVNAYNNAKQFASRSSIENTLNTPAGLGDSATSRPAFSDLVGEALQNAADAGYDSEAKSIGALAGETELEDLITAVSNAELALSTVVSVRDKVIGAYQEIMQMPM